MLFAPPWWPIPHITWWPVKPCSGVVRFVSGGEQKGFRPSDHSWWTLALSKVRHCRHRRGRMHVPETPLGSERPCGIRPAS